MMRTAKKNNNKKKKGKWRTELKSPSIGPHKHLSIENWESLSLGTTEGGGMKDRMVWEVNGDRD